MATIAGIRSRLIPTKLTGVGANARSDDYGDLFHAPVSTPAQTQAWEGSRFTALATPVVAGTGVVLGSYPTAFSDTLKIAVCITNNEAAAGKSIILDYITGRVITADTNGTSLVARAEIDSTNRYSSGGTALTVANQTPGATSPVSVATVKVGDVTCAAAGTYRTHLGMQLLKKRAAPTLTVDDTIVFSFGTIGAAIPTGVANQLITTLTAQAVPFGPAVIPPGGSFMLQLAIPAGDTAPASFNWQCGWSER